jgi:hypothetical protein
VRSSCATAGARRSREDRKRGDEAVQEGPAATARSCRRKGTATASDDLRVSIDTADGLLGIAYRPGLDGFIVVSSHSLSNAVRPRDPFSVREGSVSLIQDCDLRCRVALEENHRAQRVWSTYGAQQGQPVASTGKSAGRRNRGIKPNLLPWVATGCRGRQMVRRGSAVRVRQRALDFEKCLQIDWCCCLNEHRRAFPCSVEAIVRDPVPPVKRLQIGPLPGTSEHLRGTEGLEEPGSEGRAAKRRQ